MVSGRRPFTFHCRLLQTISPRRGEGRKEGDVLADATANFSDISGRPCINTHLNVI